MFELLKLRRQLKKLIVLVEFLVGEYQEDLKKIIYYNSVKAKNLAKTVIYLIVTPNQKLNEMGQLSR